MQLVSCTLPHGYTNIKSDQRAVWSYYYSPLTCWTEVVAEALLEGTFTALVEH